MSIFKNYFNRRALRDFEHVVVDINALEAEVKGFSDDAIKAESLNLREQVRGGTDLEEIKPRAFALTRETARRNLGQRPFDVQLIGGLVLHAGAVAEMSTGEGKTLSAVAPAYLNALKGLGVHIVTVNEYLARRDAVWMGQIYRALGLSVSCLVPQGAFLYDPDYVGARINADQNADQNADGRGSALLEKEEKTTGSFLVQQEYLRPITRREAYQADVTYGTNHEFGFDYLRDNLAYRFEDQVQRGHPFAIIDEVDSILIDEARTPLIISAPDTESSEYYKTFTRIVSRLVESEDYTVDEKFKSAAITDLGVQKVEKMAGVSNLYAPEYLRQVHYLEETLKAKAVYKRDKDYVVKNGEVVIVDEFTGRLLQGRRYNGGLHQAIEAKEGVAVQQESRTYGKISIQNYFRMYEKISGMTGTAQTSAEEFHKVYKLEVYSIPSNRPLVRLDRTDVVYKNTKAKYEAIAKDIGERYRRGQPVLVGTTSIAKNELLSAELARAGIPHEVLNAKNNEREGAIIAQAGRAKGVTVATNMAGRGVDIILGGNPPTPEEAAKVCEMGGLYVVGTERHEARRIDNQLRGRSGRQGDPGETQFYLSLEDDLLRIFGGDRIKGFMERFDLPDDEPIQMGMVARAVQEAQAKVEGANFDSRKHLLEYDDVLNKQRSAVYRERQAILTSMNRESLAQLVFDAAYAHFERLWVEAHVVPEEEETSRQKLHDLLREVHIGTEQTPIPEALENPEEAKDILTKRSVETTFDPQTPARLLSLLDMLWMNHLDDLEALSESVGLRAYGQRDPLVEYRGEASRLYKSFWVNFNEWIFMNIFRLAEKSQIVADQDADHRRLENPISVHPRINQRSSAFAESKTGRNDPCPCGAVNPATGQVYKYKKCGLINAPHHKG